MVLSTLTLSSAAASRTRLIDRTRRRQGPEKLLGRDVQLVRPQGTAAVNQRVAFEPPEENGASGEVPDVVSAHHDDGKFSDLIRHARFKTQEIRFIGPFGPTPPEISEDADQRRSAIDRKIDFRADELEEGIGRPQSGDEMQPTLPSQGRGIDPGAVGRSLDSAVGPFVAEEHTGFALRRAGGDETNRGPEFLLGLPEVREMVSGRSQRTVEA